MAPEQASGFRSFDARIDVWAVGVVLYEILTGTRAFVAENVSAVLSAVLGKSLPSLRRLRPELPPELEQVLAKAMDRDPRRRYRSGLEMQGALLRVRSKVARTSSVVLRADDEEAAAWAPEQELPTRQMASTYRR
jgi:serine/threonine protein kinase